jgi:integrase
MKLIKPEGHKTWHVEIQTEDGSKKLVDTQCLTKEGAKMLCEDAKIRELETASKAHRLTSEVVTLITANRTIAVNDVINEWDEWMKTASRSDKTRENNLISARQWAREMNLGETSIGSITSDHVHKWINRKDDPTKRGTRLMKLSAIRNLFRFATIKRYVLTDPAQLVVVDHRIMDHEQKETEHKRVFTDQEIEFLLAKTLSTAEYYSLSNELEESHSMKRMSSEEYDTAMRELVALTPEPPAVSQGFFNSAIILGRDLGIRLADICNLEWKQFDFDRKVVVVWQGKTNSRVEIPLSKRVIKLVQELPKFDKKLLFPNEAEMSKNTKRRAVLSMAFILFFRRQGFDGYSFHSLRATLATTMANQGATMKEIGEALGHTGKSQATPAYVRNPDAAAVNKR